MKRKDKGRAWRAITLEGDIPDKRLQDLAPIANFPRRGCHYQLCHEIGKVPMLVCSVPLSKREWQRVAMRVIELEWELTEQEEDATIASFGAQARTSASYQRP